MRIIRVYGILLLTATLFILPVNAKKSRYPKVKKDTHKTPMPKLNTDLVPAFDDILAELNIQHRRDSLIKMGITETRNLLRLTRMDYQMMVPYTIYTFILLILYICVAD